MCYYYNHVYIPKEPDYFEERLARQLEYEKCQINSGRKGVSSERLVRSEETLPF